MGFWSKHKCRLASHHIHSDAGQAHAKRGLRVRPTRRDCMVFSARTRSDLTPPASEAPPKPWGTPQRSSNSE
jgi:hypothetical protein